MRPTSPAVPTGVTEASYERKSSSTVRSLVRVAARRHHERVSTGPRTDRLTVAEKVQTGERTVRPLLSTGTCRRVRGFEAARGSTPTRYPARAPPGRTRPDDGRRSNGRVPVAPQHRETARPYPISTVSDVRQLGMRPLTSRVPHAPAGESGRRVPSPPAPLLTRGRRRTRPDTRPRRTFQIRYLRPNRYPPFERS